MKEIFEKLPKKELSETHNMILIDTCFFIHTFEHQKDAKLKELVQKFDVAMTSFNVEEFLFKEHSVDERVREYARKFLKSHPITIINIDVHPGNRISEKEFVNNADPDLLAEVPDASDAVLMAVAIKTKSTVLTKDKHHLFTVKLENYLKKYNIEVHKEYHDILQ
ncbi:MAG: PIN domain-containing protein [Candidatus Woesearchaeota archaeon]